MNSIKEKYDVMIVGAGFAGLSCALNLPSEYSILIVDIKPNLDIPYRSTGILSKGAKNLISSFFQEVDNFITCSHKGVAVIAPDFHSQFVYNFNNHWSFSTDTAGLIRGLSQKLGSNVTFKLNTSFVELVDLKKCVLLSNGQKSLVEFGFLVGADGVNSRVARAAKLSTVNKKILGLEKTFLGTCDIGLETSAVVHYWNCKYGRGYGGWVAATSVSGKPAIRVGLASYDASSDLLNEFIKELVEVSHISITSEVEQIGSFIPTTGILKNIYRDNVVLIGDAAGFCGPWTGDGIKGALASGKVVSDLILEHFNGQNNFHQIAERVDKLSTTVSFITKQKLFRFIWDNIHKDDTLMALFNVLQQDDNSVFKSLFAQGKERLSKLKLLVSSTKMPFKVLKFALLWLRDLLINTLKK